jgi:hypothetical protein
MKNKNTPRINEYNCGFMKIVSPEELDGWEVAEHSKETYYKLPKISKLLIKFAYKIQRVKWWLKGELP